MVGRAPRAGAWIGGGQTCLGGALLIGDAAMMLHQALSMIFGTGADCCKRCGLTCVPAANPTRRLTRREKPRPATGRSPTSTETQSVAFTPALLTRAAVKCDRERSQ